jgi:hypothetical protein
VRVCPPHARISRAISTPERRRVPTSAPALIGPGTPSSARGTRPHHRQGAAARAGTVADRSVVVGSTAITAASPDLWTLGERGGCRRCELESPASVHGRRRPGAPRVTRQPGVDRGPTLSSWTVAWCGVTPRPVPEGGYPTSARRDDRARLCVSASGQPETAISAAGLPGNGARSVCSVGWSRRCRRGSAL